MLISMVVQVWLYKADWQVLGRAGKNIHDDIRSASDNRTDNRPSELRFLR